MNSSCARPLSLTGTYGFSGVRLLSFIVDSVPYSMIAFECDGPKNQVQSLSVGVYVSEDFPRL